MLDDAGDRQIRRGQQPGRGLLPLEVDERGRSDRPVLIEALHERCALVPGLAIRMRQISACHQLVLAASPAPPMGSRRICPDRRLRVGWKPVAPTDALPGTWAVLHVENDDLPGWVALLADPVRARRAYWHLVVSGEDALPAIRAGLRHSNADVRMYCAKALDHLVDAESFPDLVAMLDDPDERVRWDTLHALACERCKDNSCRPAKHDVLDRAIRILRHDPSRHVRAIAAEVVGRWVHDDELAATALGDARDNDPDPAVRKKAGWYAAGGTISAFDLSISG